MPNHVDMFTSLISRGLRQTPLACLIALVALAAACASNETPPNANAGGATPAAATASATAAKGTQITAPLPENAFRAQLTIVNPPQTMTPGQKQTVNVKVRNVSPVTWATRGASDGKFLIELGNHWLDANNKPVAYDDGRAPLPDDLASGAEVEIPLTVTAPKTPGAYTLEFDMVQEQVSWFALKGSEPKRVKVTVK